MAASTAVGVPVELARRAVGVLRPQDAGVSYAHPRAEVARLTQRVDPEEWRRELAGQTRLRRTAEDVMAVVAEAWARLR